ncbi:MAG: transcriptional regulator [Gammaproteobacteria bacterium]|nr:transcriptional regulator [Gammaproteobacteria bacterium]NNJ85199.1 transcriptional regulator [Gammaproteobacteria bacterium]
MIKASVDYEPDLKEALADPEEAAAYLNAALEDGSRDVFLLALKDIANARDPICEPSPDRENISAKGFLDLSGLEALLDSLGLKLTVEPKQVLVP